MLDENRKTLRQSALYVCIGALASSADGLLYLLFTRQFGIWYLAANFTGTKLFGFSDIPVKMAAVVLAGIVQFLFNKIVTYGKI